jgi:hypothetical protein
MPITDDQVQQVVARIARDLTATLGWERQRAEARAERVARRFADWWEPGQDSFAFLVADAVQDEVLEDRIDTTWPACPLHPWHPLWLSWEREPPIWRCTTTGTEVAPLGGLPDTRQR